MLHADALPIPTRKPPIAVRMAIIQSIAFFTFSGSICLSIFMNLNVNFYVKTDTFAFYYVKYKIFLSDCQRVCTATQSLQQKRTTISPRPSGPKAGRGGGVGGEGRHDNTESTTKEDYHFPPPLRGGGVGGGGAI